MPAFAGMEAHIFDDSIFGEDIAVYFNFVVRVVCFIKLMLARGINATPHQDGLS